MRSPKLAVALCVGALGGFSGSAALAVPLAATATISSTGSGPYNYTLQLTNTGTGDIGTFWFAWTPPGNPVEYDFLPTAPSATNQPVGWTGFISAGFPGTSIEYSNTTGSLIGPGQTATFGFTSVDTPATLQGLDNFFHAFPITESFIYAAPPSTPSELPPGAFAQVNPALVPEPASLGVIFIGAAGLLASRRRGSQHHG